MIDSDSMPEQNKKSYYFRGFAFLLLIAVLILLDQWTKMLAVIYLKDSKPFVIVEGVLELTYLENTGAAFGIFRGMTKLFLFFAPVVSVLMYFMAFRYSRVKKLYPLVGCFLCIAAGGIGNFIDRVKHAYVIDFIYFKLIDFPVFNVADIYVTCSCFLMLFLIIFYYKEDDFNADTI